VVVESDDSSNDESDVDAENSVTSDEEYEEFIKKAKRVFLPQVTQLIPEYTHSTLVTTTWSS